MALYGQRMAAFRAVDKIIDTGDILVLANGTAYVVEIAKSADAEIRGVRDIKLLARILARIEAVAADPTARRNYVSPLKGGGFRLRSGDWRVLFTLDHDARRMTIVAVRPRGKAYR